MSSLLIILTVLSSFLAKLETQPLRSTMTATIDDPHASPVSYPGWIYMYGEKFRVGMYGIEAAYDGKTLYMYDAQVDELTLSIPKEEELVQANPFLFAKALIPLCEVSEYTAKNGHTTVTLIPKDPSIGIDRFSLTINSEDLLPLKVRIKEGDKWTTLQLKKPMYGENNETYVLKGHENTYINDLR